MKGARNPWILYGFLTFLFFLYRFTPLFTAIERLTYIDELDIGTIGREFLTGMKLPFWAYQWDEYAGECLVLGAAAAGFFKLLGANLFALKLVPLLFSFLSFSVLFIFTLRYFGVLAAVLTALLLLFCPPAFTQLSLLPMAGRTEPLLLGMLGLFAFYEFFYRRNLSSAWGFFFGVISGIAFWFYFANALVVAACLLTWAIQKPSALKSRALLFAGIGFLAAVTPCFFLMRNHLEISTGFFSSSILGYLASGETWVRLPRKILRLFLKDLPAAYVFFPSLGIPERISSALFFLFHGGLFLKSAANREAKILPLLLIPALTLLGLIFTSFDLGSIYGFVGVRYLSPWFFYTCPLIACFLSSFKWRNAVLAVWLGLSLVTHEALLFKEIPGRAREYLGYSYQHLGGRGLSFLRHFVNTPEDFLRILSRFSKDERYFFFRGMSSFALDSGIKTLLEDREIAIEPLIPQIDPEAQVFFQEWKDGEERKVGVNALPFGFYGYPPDPQKMLEQSFRRQPEKLNAEVYWGVGWKIRGYFGEDRLRGMDWIKRLPQAFQESALQGFLACENWYKIPSAT